jgi:hypothetical protein
MKQVSEMPTSGQFVAVYETSDGSVHSENLMWSADGALLYINDDGFHEEVNPCVYSIGCLFIQGGNQ